MKSVDPRRVFSLNKAPQKNGPVVYWMSREQRVSDNWSLLYAQELARNNNQPLVVVFALAPKFLDATIRQYAFLIRGLQEVEQQLSGFSIPFFLRLGNPPEEIIRFCEDLHAGALVTDFDPLHVKKNWRSKVAKKLSVACFEVDAHNIIPCRILSDKQEYAAYTIRPKVHRLISKFLKDFPKLKAQKGVDIPKAVSPDWELVNRSLKINRKVPEVDWCKPGESAAQQVLRQFLKHRLKDYATKRNDPNSDAQSQLSPYLHFGQISAGRVALAVQKSMVSTENKEAFLEELVVRRELAENFCFYNSNYDSVACFPAWAQKTLQEHVRDTREYVYTLKEFELAQTHDPLWNAAQLEMVRTGKMHGYMRMYWAKKILEWTKNPNEAMKIAIFLNDTYELDGRDPNGYAGIAWSIGGVHDRAWFDRPIFGKIRFMNFNGCKSKFDVDQYISRFT